MNNVNAGDTLGFEVSSAAVGKLSASSRDGGRPRYAWYNEWWNGGYISAHPDTPKREISAATTASFAELLGRASAAA